MRVSFFSSRRRHTSSKRDWSSDVCSSDLAPRRGGHGVAQAGLAEGDDLPRVRSEERRVGKGCRTLSVASYNNKHEVNSVKRATTKRTFSYVPTASHVKTGMLDDLLLEVIS